MKSDRRIKMGRHTYDSDINTKEDITITIIKVITILIASKFIILFFCLVTRFKV